LNEAQSSALQLAVNRYVAACGCREGKVGTLLAVTSYAVYLWGTSSLTLGWSQLGVGAGVLALGAVAGKAAGLLRARIALRESIRQLQSLLLREGRLPVAREPTLGLK
jgi:hypothetical protein